MSMEVKQWRPLVLLPERNLDSARPILYISGPNDGRQGSVWNWKGFFLPVCHSSADSNSLSRQTAPCHLGLKVQVNAPFAWRWRSTALRAVTSAPMTRTPNVRHPFVGHWCCISVLSVVICLFNSTHRWSVFTQRTGSYKVPVPSPLLTFNVCSHFLPVSSVSITAETGHSSQVSAVLQASPQQSSVTSRK